MFKKVMYEQTLQVNIAGTAIIPIIIISIFSFSHDFLKKPQTPKFDHLATYTKALVRSRPDLNSG